MQKIDIGTDFSGIGAPEQALKQMGVPHNVKFAFDKDKYAKQTYQANHEAEVFYDDIVARDHAAAPYVDLYCFGFPCQAFSISGKRKGFDDIRGTLFFNSAEYIRTNRPAAFLAENVKGLLSHDKPKGSKAKHGRTFSTIINLLAKTVNGQQQMQFYDDNLGYNIFYTVLNSKYYDVPQNRERVFIVGFRDDVDFNFPNSKTVNKRLRDVLEPVVDDKYFLSGAALDYLAKGASGNYSDRMTFLNKETDDTAGCITANHSKGVPYNMLEIIVPEGTKNGFAVANNYDSINTKNLNSKTRRGRVGKQIANTLDTKNHQTVVVPDVSNVGNIFNGNPQAGRIVDPAGLSPTVGTNNDSQGYIPAEVIQLNDAKEYGQQPSQQNRVYDTDGVRPALMAGMSSGTHAIVNSNRIRRLTPLECMRLQGFPDDFVKPCSDTQIYKQAGNSITVTVLIAIFTNIFKSLKLWDGMHIQA